MRYIFGFMFGVALTLALIVGYLYVSSTAHTPVVQTPTPVFQAPVVNQGGQKISTPTPAYEPPNGNWSPDEVTYLEARMPHLVAGLTALVNSQTLTKQASQNMSLLNDQTWLDNMNADTATMIAEGEAMQTTVPVPASMASVESHVQRIAGLLVMVGNNLETGIYDYNHSISGGLQDLTQAADQMDQISTEFHTMSAEMTTLEQRP